jgi:hypothetical protein
MCWFGGNDLRDARGTMCQAVGQELEVGELVVNGSGEFDSALLVEAKGFLEMGEHARSDRDGESHTSEFTEELVPLFGGDAAASLEEIEQLLDAQQTVGRKFNGAANGINEPAEDCFKR